MPEPRHVHHLATGVMSVLMVIIGVAMVVSTLARGGGPFAIGVLVGLMFIAAGGGRIYVARRAG